jgi:hypothetical protein
VTYHAADLFYEYFSSSIVHQRKKILLQTRVLPVQYQDKHLNKTSRRRLAKTTSKETGNIPDLMVSQCLFGCNNGDCAGTWINRAIGHRIVCDCKCNNHENEESSMKSELQGASSVTSHKRQAEPEPEEQAQESLRRYLNLE